MVSTYFPHVRREVMLLDMLAQACLAKGEMLYKNRNATEYICLLRKKKSFMKPCCTSSVRCSQFVTIYWRLLASCSFSGTKRPVSSRTRPESVTIYHTSANDLTNIQFSTLHIEVLIQLFLELYGIKTRTRLRSKKPG